MTTAVQEFDYDALLEAVERARAQHAEPSWVVARSPKAAQAFAQWCVDNGIEEPQIVVRGLGAIPID